MSVLFNDYQLPGRVDLLQDPEPLTPNPDPMGPSSLSLLLSLSSTLEKKPPIVEDDGVLHHV